MDPSSKDDKDKESMHPAAKIVRAMFKAEEEYRTRELSRNTYREDYPIKDTSPDQTPKTHSRRELWYNTGTSSLIGY